MSARFNEVFVVDSIPDGEFNTAKALVKDMQDWQAVVGGEPPSVAYHRVESSQEFVALIYALAGQAEAETYIPLLHVECHGSPKGLGFADNSFLDWKEVAKPLQALNVSTKLNLVVLISACDGSYLASVMEIHDRAPVWAVLGPVVPMEAGQLLEAFTAYYSALFMSASSVTAYEALQATSEGAKFTQISAEEMFRLVCRSYMRDYGSKSGIRLRALKMQARLPRGRRLNRREIEAHYRNPKYFNKFRNIFFMVDLYGEHDKRFPTYHEALNRKRVERTEE